jgi:hypothetical protein
LVHGFALTDDDALALLREYSERCDPPWSERELLHKIESARNASHTMPRGHLLGSIGVRTVIASPQPQRPIAGTSKPKIDPATATEGFLKGFRCGEADVWEASPVRPPDDWTQDGALLVAMLYGPQELVNVVVEHTLDKHGKANPAGRGVTLPRDEMIRRLKTGSLQSEAGGWLRMNPLDGHGVADANVTAFRFALLECDSVPTDLQLSFYAKLPLPIAVILTSGGRSVHAWVKVEATDLKDYRLTYDRMRALLAKFGVDRKNRNPSRLSRLPGVQRIIGAAGDGRQRLLYLNPEPKQEAIL